MLTVRFIHIWLVSVLWWINLGTLWNGIWFSNFYRQRLSLVVNNISYKWKLLFLSVCQFVCHYVILRCLLEKYRVDLEEQDEFNFKFHAKKKFTMQELRTINCWDKAYTSTSPICAMRKTLKFGVPGQEASWLLT